MKAAPRWHPSRSIVAHCGSVLALSLYLSLYLGAAVGLPVSRARARRRDQSEPLARGIGAGLRPYQSLAQTSSDWRRNLMSIILSIVVFG